MIKGQGDKNLFRCSLSGFHVRVFLQYGCDKVGPADLSETGQELLPVLGTSPQALQSRLEAQQEVESDEQISPGLIF